MDKKYLSTSFSENFEKINDEFIKCTISVMTHEQIANGTKFTRDSIDAAMSTLNYAPVIGYFNEEDFEGHAQEIVLTDNGMEMKIKTVPFGVVIKDSQRYEKVMKPNGEFEEYLVADAYLWGRYEEATKRVMQNKCNQSMEVLCKNGAWKDDYYEVTEFSFSGLCILGEDVTPAFNLAQIRTCDKFTKDEFKARYEEMTAALNKFFEEGDSEMEEDKIKDIEPTDDTQENPEVSATEDCSEGTCKCSKCEEDVVGEDFAEGEEIICAKCKPEKQKHEDESEEEKVDYEEIISNLTRENLELTERYSELEVKYESLKVENERLAAFEKETLDAKRLAAEGALFEQFAELEGFAGFEELKANSKEFDLETLETKLFALLGKKNFSAKQSKKQIKDTVIKVPVFAKDEELSEAEKRYGKGIRKYLNN